MRLAVMDVETTGLDPDKDTLLEIAVVLYETETNLNISGKETLQGVLGVFHRVLFYKPLSYSHLKHEVYEMHTENGLFDECHEGDMLDPTNEALAKFLGDGPTYPCGRNVHFDMSFVKRHLPKSAKLFSYRHVDVTTLELLGKVAKIPRPPTTHRALHDVINELEVLRRALA